MTVILQRLRQRYSLPDSCPRNWFTELYENTLRLEYSITMVIVAKRTGMSKSWSALSLAEFLDPKGFTAQDIKEGRYCFYSDKFINKLRTDFQPFRWLIFEEPGRKGSGGSKHEWQSEANKSLSSTAQMSRFQLPVCAFVLPHRLYLAEHLFSLAQIMLVFEERGIARVYGIEVSELEPHNIKTPFYGELVIPPPKSQELVDAAEDLKKQVWNVDTEKWEKDAINQQAKHSSSIDYADEIITKGIRNEMMTKDDKGTTKYDIKKIAMYARCGQTKAREIRDYLEIKS